MIKHDDFSSYHPIVNFLYFVFVLGITAFVMHPVLLGISLVSAVVYSVYLNGKSAWKFNFIMIVPTLIIMALINPTFNHRGETILLYINDNPLTLESIVYGIITAAMFVAMILWFACYNAVMSSDKFIYLFGKIIPALSLIFSMCLRFVPRFKTQIKIISNAQRCIGRDVKTGSLLERIKNSLRIISIMTTWALENAIETADSMKARGYGLKGRTAFSNFYIQKRDYIVLSIMGVSILFIVAMVISKQVFAIYIPRLAINETNLWSIMFYAEYIIVCNIPVLINIREDIRWNSLQSKI